MVEVFRRRACRSYIEVDTNAYYGRGIASPFCTFIQLYHFLVYFVYIVCANTPVRPFMLLAFCQCGVIAYVCLVLTNVAFPIIITEHRYALVLGGGCHVDVGFGRGLMHSVVYYGHVQMLGGVCVTS